MANAVVEGRQGVEESEEAPAVAEEAAEETTAEVTEGEAE